MWLIISDFRHDHATRVRHYYKEHFKRTGFQMTNFKWVIKNVRILYTNLNHIIKHKCYYLYSASINDIPGQPVQTTEEETSYRS